MKNGLLIWNVVLTLAAGYLLITHFSAKKSNTITLKETTKDSLSNNDQFKIAYFEMDSIASNFEVVKGVKAELAKKEQEINDEMDKMGKNLQQRYTYYQNLAAGGNMTQAQTEAAGIELKKLDDDMKTRKQQLDQDYFDVKTRRENDVKTKIEGFIKEYNKDKNFTYIMSYEPGLFYYKDTAYNITGDVIKGLNKAYPPGKANK